MDDEVIANLYLSRSESIAHLTTLYTVAEFTSIKTFIEL